MPAQANIDLDDELFTGKDRTLQFTVVDAAGAAQAITGWALKWVLCSNQDRRTPLVSKTVGSGITITNGAGGICQVAITDDDTATLAGAEDPKYFHELSRTDSGNEDVLAYGTVVLRQSPTS